MHSQDTGFFSLEPTTYSDEDSSHDEDFIMTPQNDLESSIIQNEDTIAHRTRAKMDLTSIPIDEFAGNLTSLQ